MTYDTWKWVADVRLVLYDVVMEKRQQIHITRWNSIHADFKTGSIRDGSTKILRNTPEGTCLVPVEVVR